MQRVFTEAGLKKKNEELAAQQVTDPTQAPSIIPSGGAESVIPGAEKSTDDKVETLSPESPPTETEPYLEKGPPVASPIVVTPTQNCIAGGVAAEVGDGGPPATLSEVFDGTTVYTGTDGEITILATSTQQASLKTEAPAHPPLQPDPVTPVPSSPTQPQTEEKTSGDDPVEDEQEDEEDDGEEDGEEEEDEEDESLEESAEEATTSAPDSVVSDSPQQTLDTIVDDQPAVTSTDQKPVSSADTPSMQPSETEPEPSLTKNLPDPVPPLALLKMFDAGLGSEFGSLMNDIPKPTAFSQPPDDPSSPIENLNIEHVHQKPVQEQLKSSEATESDTSGVTGHPSTRFENMDEVPSTTESNEEGSASHVDNLQPTPPPIAHPSQPFETLPPQDVPEPPPTVPIDDIESTQEPPAVPSKDIESNQAPSTMPSNDTESSQTPPAVSTNDLASTQAPPAIPIDDAESTQAPLVVPSQDIESTQAPSTDPSTEPSIPPPEISADDKEETLPPDSPSADTAPQLEKASPILGSEEPSVSPSGELSYKNDLTLSQNELQNDSIDVKDFVKPSSPYPSSDSGVGANIYSSTVLPVPREPSVRSERSPYLPPTPEDVSAPVLPVPYGQPSESPPSDPTEPSLPPPIRSPMYPGLFPKSDPIRPSDEAPSEEDTKASVGVGSVEILTPQVPEDVPEPVVEEVTPQDSESPGMFSGITNLFSGLIGTGEQVPEEETSESSIEKTTTASALPPLHFLEPISALAPSGEFDLDSLLLRWTSG